MVKLSSYGQNLDSAMFDFLKDSKCTGNKYYSTSQIPYFIGEDLLEHNKGDVELTEDTHNSKWKPEIFTPFFAIEEDLEMEDDVSNSDEHTSETNKYNNQFYLSGSSTGNSITNLKHTLLLVIYVWHCSLLFLIILRGFFIRIWLNHFWIFISLL